MRCRDTVSLSMLLDSSGHAQVFAYLALLTGLARGNQPGILSLDDGPFDSHCTKNDSLWRVRVEAACTSPTLNRGAARV